jgi:hypothetical protein
MVDGCLVKTREVKVGLSGWGVRGLTEPEPTLIAPMRTGWNLGELRLGVSLSVR